MIYAEERIETRLGLTGSSKRRFLGGLRRSTILAGLGVCVGLSSPVLARSAAPSDQDIVVTAQKRPELMQNVPIAVQVVTGATIAERALTTLNNLTASMPGVTVSAATYGAFARIRGQFRMSPPKTPRIWQEIGECWASVGSAG